MAAVAFSSDGSMFVTVGMRHVKFWYLESSRSKVRTRPQAPNTVTLQLILKVLQGWKFLKIYTPPTCPYVFELRHVISNNVAF